MPRLLKSILMLLFLAPTLASAQTRNPLSKGQRVRVVTRCEMARDSLGLCRAPVIASPHAWTYSGQLEALDADTLRIRVGSNTAVFAIATTAIARLSVVDGTRGHFWTGAGMGLLGGVLIGGIIGSTQNLEGSFLFSNTNPTLLGAVVGAPAGVLLGGVIGALIRSDRWQAVPMNDQRIRVVPRLGAWGFTVMVTF